MIEALGYNFGWFLKTDNGKIYCVETITPEVWSKLDPDESFRQKFPTHDHAVDFLCRACEKIGPIDIFFDKDVHGWRRFNQQRFAETEFIPPLPTPPKIWPGMVVFSNHLDEKYRLSENMEDLIFEDGLKVNRELAAIIAKLPQAQAREAIRKLREARDAADELLYDAITFVWDLEDQFLSRKSISALKGDVQ